LILAERTPHVTIKYGIETNDVEEVAAALGKFIPIRLMFGATKMFMASDINPTDVVMIQMFGMSLLRLRRKIESVLVTHDNKPYYYPHLTLAFVNEHASIAYVGNNPFIGEKVVVDRVVFNPVNGQKKIITTNGEILDYAGISS
jgi:2'-5' RNA ligase